VPLLSAVAVESAPADATRGTVRDRFWAWAHEAHVYDGLWGLPMNGRITPVEGAHFLGVPNIIMIRYEGEPAPPFEQYAVPFRSLKRVDWSLTGASGATSEEEREHVFRLAAGMPNLTGVFLDDFFTFTGTAKPHWLADNHPVFPVQLTLQLDAALPLTRLELAQSDWPSGDYRSADFRVEALDADGAWQPIASGKLPNAAGARVGVPLDGTLRAQLRLAILGTHDVRDARSCGLSGLRLWTRTEAVAGNRVRWQASSSHAGHGPENLAQGEGPDEPEAPAALSVEQLRTIRSRLDLQGRHLTLGVTLYTHQLAPRIRAHLNACDVVSLWTWEADDLVDLEANFARLKSLAPDKAVRLGCYLWDFGARRPMPVEAMKRQCEFGLQQLRAGAIEGMIFLATNVCDLRLETVEWTRAWIAEVGPQTLT